MTNKVITIMMFGGRIHDQNRFEAVASRPGGTPPDSAAFNRWIWHETELGRLLKAAKERCLSEKDEALRQTGALLLVPLEQV